MPSLGAIVAHLALIHDHTTVVCIVWPPVCDNLGLFCSIALSHDALNYTTIHTFTPIFTYRNTRLSPVYPLFTLFLMINIVYIPPHFTHLSQTFCHYNATRPLNVHCHTNLPMPHYYHGLIFFKYFLTFASLPSKRRRR